jgi:hypothetical protein
MDPNPTSAFDPKADISLNEFLPRSRTLIYVKERSAPHN